MRKVIVILLSVAAYAISASASVPDSLKITFSDEYLDTVQLKQRPEINNYSMIGVSYGVNFCGQYFNPEFQQKWRFSPGYYSVMFSHYEKMFDYLPYFGFTVGVAYGKEGFEFARDPRTGEAVRTLRGADKCFVDLLEIPFLIEGHYDAERMRILADIGAYAGYRFNIVREGNVEEAIRYDFDEKDIRFDYGIIAGVGLGYVLEPFEFHVKAQFRFSWQNMVQPDFLDKYKWYFASPMGLTAQFGIFYHLTRRRGKTNADLRREARAIVYGENK